MGNYSSLLTELRLLVTKSRNKPLKTYLYLKSHRRTLQLKTFYLLPLQLLILNASCSPESTTNTINNKQRKHHKPKAPAVTSYSYAVTDFGEKTGSHSKTIQVIKNYIGNHKPSLSTSSEEVSKSYSSVDYISKPKPTESDSRYELEKLVDPSQVRYVEVAGETTTKRPAKKHSKQPKPTPALIVRDREELTEKPRPRSPPKADKIEGDVEFVETSEGFDGQSQSLGFNKNLKYTVYDENKRDPKATISASVFGRGTPSSIGFSTKSLSSTETKSREVYHGFGKNGHDSSKSSIGFSTKSPSSSETKSFEVYHGFGKSRAPAASSIEDNFKDAVYKTVPAATKTSPSGQVNRIPDKQYSPEIDVKQINFKTQREIIHSTIRPINTITVTSSTGKRFDLPRSTSANHLPPYVAPTKAPLPTPKAIFNVGITSTAIPYYAPNVRDYYQKKAAEETGPIFFPGVGYGGILFNEQTGEPDLPQALSPQKSPGISSRLPPKPLYNYNRGFLFNLNASIKNPNFNNNVKPYTKLGRSRGFRFGG